MPSQTTYTDTDWEIWLYKPVANKFQLDFSKLDDATAPLSSTDGTIEILDCDIASISIDEGGSPTQGIFVAVTPAVANIQLQVDSFTKTDANQYFAGADIWITLKNGMAYGNVNSNLGKRTPMFMGRIRSFDVSVQPGTTIASINLNASSRTEDDLNVLMTIDTDSGSDKNVLIGDAAEALGIYSDLPISGVTTFYHRGSVTKTYGEFIAEMVATDIQIPNDRIYWTSQTGTTTSPNIAFSAGIRTISTPLRTKTIGYTHTSSKISSVQFGWDNAEAPTGVSLTNEGNSNLVYQYGSGVTGGGMYTANVDLADVSWMESVGKQYLIYKKAFVPQIIETVTARNNDTITWGDSGNSYPALLWPINLSQVGDCVGVTLTDNGFTAEKMLVVGRTIEVQDNLWKTTYKLWKGYSTT